MVSVHDVASYILEKKSPITAMKLQKLVYYSQAWHLVWEEEELFKEKIQAWANGPVVRELYNNHKGMFKVRDWKYGDSSNLTINQKESIDKVIEFYGDKNPQWLSDLTHSEAPWINARKGLAPLERGEKEITLDSIIEYYSSL